MNEAASGYGPTALATPANALTAARLLAAPVFVGLIAAEGATWLTVAVGVAVAGSDGVDGWLARRQGATRSGAFLDPLADKVVVLGAFFALAAQGHLPWLPVALITIREVGMSGYRSWAGRRGVSIPARRSAKVKTVVQELAIATCLVPPLAAQYDLQRGAVWAAAALTLSSGVQYLWDGRRALRATAVQRSAAPGAGAAGGDAPSASDVPAPPAPPDPPPRPSPA
jgi:CDP-diacylglycerol---glycerol-3-phosphate 3-phosphatidyltransferase